jgi:alkaline phosphatase D
MGLEDLRWLDLVHRVETRRDFLRIGARAAALIACGGTLAARRGDVAPRFRSEPFELGIASGDPMPDGLVLWTRLAGRALEETGAQAEQVPVRWEVAEDEGFTRVVRSGEALAIPELGHSVHVEVDGLRPAYVYHYRFLSGGAVSAVGRSRTAPAPGEPTDRLRFAFCSCQNWEDGWYTAYRHMTGEDLDLVVHLGDYIYEIGQSNRAVRHHEGPELFTLDQYRSRYALYRTDPDLQAVHAAFAWTATWDDHDVDNNYAGAIPENGDPALFLQRRIAAYQAYYEFLPLRRRSVPRGPDMSMYRSLQFGDLMAMSVLDTRQYRDDQPCGDRFKPDCDARFDPTRDLLGGAQESWLLGRLAESRDTTKWSVLAQQVMMAPLKNWNTDGDPTHSMDTWDGYPAARQRVLEAFGSGAVRNPVVITGDVHSSWVADLHAGETDSPVVGTEFVCSSITTNMDGYDVPAADGFREWNPHLRYHEERRGYVSCEVTPERFQASFRFVPWVTRPDAPLQTRAAFVVEDGRPGAVRDL